MFYFALGTLVSVGLVVSRWVLRGGSTRSKVASGIHVLRFYVGEEVRGIVP